MDEIQALIDAYNTAQHEQLARLQALFLAVRARHGYRSVRFSGDIWSNCWDLDPYLALPRFVNSKVEYITELVPGTTEA